MASWSPKSVRVIEHAATRVDEDAVAAADSIRRVKVALLRRERRVTLASDHKNRWNERTRRLAARRRARTR